MAEETSRLVKLKLLELVDTVDTRAESKVGIDVVKLGIWELMELAEVASVEVV